MLSRYVAILPLILATCVPGLAATCPQPDEAARQAGQWTAIGTFDRDKDMVDFSGIDCVSDTDCLMVSDETRDVFGVALDRQARTMTISRRGDLERRPSFNGDKRELDLEAVAAVEGDYVVVGSHGLRRKPDFAAEDSYQPSRFAIYRVSDRKPVTTLNSVFLQHPVLDEYARRPLGLNGINIEGLAYRDGQLFVGFRAPIWTRQDLAAATSFDQAFVLQIGAGITSGADVGAGTLHAVTLANGEGIRAMEEVGDGFLLLTGPASPDAKDPILIDRTTGAEMVYAAPADVPHRIVKWKPGDSATTELAALKTIEGDKAEGLVVLSEAPDMLRLLVIHDTGPCGRPTEVDIKLP
jgi:hypothetical protein